MLTITFLFASAGSFFSALLIFDARLAVSMVLRPKLPVCRCGEVGRATLDDVGCGIALPPEPIVELGGAVLRIVPVVPPPGAEAVASLDGASALRSACEPAFPPTALGWFCAVMGVFAMVPGPLTPAPLNDRCSCTFLTPFTERASALAWRRSIF